MLKTSGLVLDVHDDINGEILRQFYPSLDAVPETIKQAHALTSTEKATLPDEDFALILLDGDQQLRKYACIDEGNTQLALLYFAANAHKLPEEAQKTAASNLVTACGWYGIPVPEAIEKIAISLGTGLQLLSLPSTAKGVHSQIKNNLSNIHEHEAMGGTVTPMKMAEVSGTSLMPSQPPSDPSVMSSKRVIPKTAGIGHLLSGHKSDHGDYGPEETERYDGYTKGKQPEKNPQAKTFKPHVDVSNKEPSTLVVEKKAQVTAMEDGRYPLDSYTQVKAAAAYFGEFGKQFSPEERHEFCVSLVKRANSLNIPVSAAAQKYGSEEFAPEEEIKVAFDMRRNSLKDEVELLVLTELEEKRASISPELFCVALEQFDKLAGLDFLYDSHIPDPYYSTFGVKEAEEYSFIHNGEKVTEKELVDLSLTKNKSLMTTFGMEFANSFRKDPVGIFKSLPLPQKRMVLHMAVDNAPGSEHVV